MTRSIQCRVLPGVVACLLCLAIAGPQARQSEKASAERAEDAAGFKQFTDRVQTYVRLQKDVVSGLPTLKPTDLPEMITAYQQALARKLREARPRAKAGDLFTSSAREAFRHASQTALGGPGAGKVRAHMQPGAPNPQMRLVVNGIYPDAEPVTAIPPELLAGFPVLPAEVAYRVVGRTLIVIDVKSRLIVDVARRILPPAS